MDEDDRTAWGLVHPQMMGGEYLPDLDDDEIEIARIEMQSTTGDVISLRAKRAVDGTGLISYRLCDEYPEHEMEYTFSPVQSREPLTFGELAQLLETFTACEIYEDIPQGLWGTLACIWDSGLGDRRQLTSFISISSPFYPQLRAYFRWRVRKWLADRLCQDREQKREEPRRAVERMKRLEPSATTINDIIERECRKKTWSGMHAAMGRGHFREQLRRRLEDKALTTGDLTGE